ncbi:isochorismatase family protein [Sneathiella sp. P13V-1]|uniref:isochorismatase family protein n=1 Tax=Sneathiella sp. P13V-1 TaxID=2697366 RepID=UPI00187B3C51|nr:isochorismatase family protein [Sneathiella sp. P13V-1]MBE7637262.1 isochorismatase family protein [Sneathiella sp. P13V-1]
MQISEITTALEGHMPLGFKTLNVLSDCRKAGLVIVDEINGFATVGAGNLAPPVPNDQVTTMVSETDRIARAFSANDLPVLAFLDTHEPGKAEPPYPPHCEAGTGEEELVPELEWLHEDENATLVRKDCINGFIGAFDKDGGNAVMQWVADNGITDLLVVGICTDICVMDFVLTSLSARNHDMLSDLKEIYVYDKGCATFDMPKEVAVDVGLPETSAHPQDITHYMGLYFMASRGAGLVNQVNI